MFNAFKLSFFQPPRWPEILEQQKQAIPDAIAQGKSKLLLQFIQTLQAGNTTAVTPTLTDYQDFCALIKKHSPAINQIMGNAVTQMLPATTSLQLFVSVAHLLDGYTYLTQQPGSARTESMLAWSGTRINAHAFTLDYPIAVKIARQSTGNAEFDFSDFSRHLIKLQRNGMALFSIWHTHPGNGPQSPSATDRSFQRVLDTGRYQIVQCVFSQDGFLRFFAGKHPFQVTIYGKGVEKIDVYTYKLTQVHPLRRPTFAQPD